MGRYFLSDFLSPNYTLFYHKALAIETCCMLTAEPSTYDMFCFRFFKREIKRNVESLMATYDNFQTCCMLMAKP